MVLAAPLPHPRRPGTFLLRAGFEIEHATIARLEELGVKHLWIKYPGLEDLARFADPKVTRAASNLARTLDLATDSIVQDRHARLDYTSFRDAVTSMLGALAGNAAAAFLLDELGPGTYEARHAANVCMTSVLLGLRLAPYVIRERSRLHPTKARELTELGVGAMLHDIGMLQLPREVRDRFARDGDESDPEFRQHTALGFKIVKDWVSPASASIVLNHHQRFDGTGFPARRTLGGELPPPIGRQIHIFHRIVAGADLLDRLRYPPSGERDEHIPTVRALAALLKAPLRERLDPIVLTAIFHCVPAFTPGSIVTLSDGGLAAVTDWHPLDPCRPSVQRLPNLDPSAEEGERIDLRTSSTVSIAQAGGVDVRGDIFVPQTNDEFSLSKLLKRLDNRADDLAA
jgi:HD-GYP domain-containing protein (c-di-GMP phosphodiesterase class II)